ncbi:MAG: M64 family metallo-endopeptidase [Bacteroidales bacterium]|nr:M64 family metallo-endopeptidase [Bacteroidales bacterium]
MKNIATNLLLIIFLSLTSCSKDPGNPDTPDNSNLSISETDILVSASGSETKTFTITSDAVWSLSLSDTKSAPSWCQASPKNGNAGTTTVTVTISEQNSSFDDRNTYIKVTSGENSKLLTVTQKKKNAIILTKEKFEIDGSGGEIQIELQANVDYSVLIPHECSSWISKIDSKTKGLSSKKEMFQIEEGDIEGSRSGIIVFASAELKDTVHIYQTQKNALILSKREYECTCDASILEVELKSNIEYVINIPTEATWIRKVDSKVSRVDKISFSIDKNTDYDFRSAKIIIKDKNSSLSDTLIVRQSQKNAFILGSNHIDKLSCCGENFSVRIKTNTSFTCEIPSSASQWLSVVETKGLRDTSVNFKTTANTDFDREAIIIFKGKGELRDTLYISQDGTKKLLMDFYDATGGDNWKDKSNWGSSLPISEWYGVDASGDNRIYLNLYNNNLSGYIPESLGRLNNLSSLNLFNNNISGDIGALIDTISKIQGLTIINLRSNKFTGEISSKIGNFKELTALDLSRNSLTGVIPAEICGLTKLTTLSLYNNRITGKIPDNIGLLPLSNLNLTYNLLTAPLPLSLLKMTNWPLLMDYVINQTDYTIYPPAEYAKIQNHQNKDFNLQPFKAYDVISAYKYTILYFYDYDCVWSNTFTPLVVDLVNKYRSKGLGAISYHACILSEYGKLDKIKEYVRLKKMDNFVNLLHAGEYIDNYGTTKWDDSYFFGSLGTPAVMVVDKNGTLVRGYTEDRSKLPEFIASLLGAPDNMYESTDYSKDGAVVTLQRATIGTGINIVILGDGFVDKDMTSGGKYETWAKDAMEAFFNVEPVKSFRNRFNVYCVKAVSKNEGIGSFRESVFSTQYGDGALVGGDNTKCKQYALKVPSLNDLSNTTIITILNDPKYAGTCYMYADNSSVSYCPYVGYDKEQFSQIIHHEAVGHGFGKLADEYSYNGTIKASLVKSYRDDYYTMQWWSNIDFTKDAQKVKWASFLNDILYSTTVGIFEGGATYQLGVYRPSENSIMRYNVGDFNAPSRLEIYRRILEFSGDEYLYNNFIQYDAINRITTKAPFVPPVHFVPLAPPVVMD